MSRPAVYIASSLLNAARARMLAEHLAAVGFRITMPWWELAEPATGDEPLELPDLAMIALLEHQAVVDADLLILLLPGRLGAHTELGIAIGAGKPILVWDEQTGAAFRATPDANPFYHLPQVTRGRGDLDQLINRQALECLVLGALKDAQAGPPRFQYGHGPALLAKLKAVSA